MHASPSVHQFMRSDASLERDAGHAAQVVHIPGPWRLRNGGTLPEIDVVYETWGALTPAKDNVLLLCTGLSPRAHARSSGADPRPGWWEEMIGPGQPIDTDRYYVVCVNNLGSCFGTTGPASINPRTGKPYRLDFPVLTIEDIAATSREALRRLGIDRVAALVGPSLGGMTALAYAMMFPDEVDALMLISSAGRASPFAIAIHSLQREAIVKDPAWKGGYYAADAPPALGMRLARKIGMVSYRSAAEWRDRFWRERTESWSNEPFGAEFEVEAYLESHAQKFVNAFDANAYLYLSRAMDLFDAAEHGGSLEAGLARVVAKRTLVIGVETDILFPVEQQRALADGLAKAGREVELVVLPSVQGHDAFLVDMERFGPPISRFLNGR